MRTLNIQFPTTTSAKSGSPAIIKCKKTRKRTQTMQCPNDLARNKRTQTTGL